MTPASSSQPFRLASGGLIERRQPLSFRFDGKSYQGYAGDTLASALIANGVRLVGAFVQIPSPARHSLGGAGGAERAGRAAQRGQARTEHACHGHRALSRPRSRQPEPLALARFRHPVDQFAPRPGADSGFLLQDLHVAGELLGEALRAADPARGRPRPRGGAGGSRPLREGFRLLRRAGDRRRSSRACGRARGGTKRRAGDPLRRGFPPWWSDCCASFARSTAAPLPTGWRRRWPSSKPCPASR